MNRAQLTELFWAVEAVISAIEKCHLRKPQRAKVDATIHLYRQAFIRLSEPKKQQKKK